MAQCCGEEMYKDCNGNERCEQCQPPCPCCYDGGMDNEEEEEEAFWLTCLDEVDARYKKKS